MVPGSVSFRLLSTDHVGIKRQLRQETRVETKSIPDGVLLKVLGVDLVADIDVRREPSPIGFGRYKEAGQVRPAGSHTMVGNGAYLGPDLTGEYKRVGPAWLAAFLPSAGGWPTTGAVRAQLLDPDQQADTGTD